MIPTIEDWSGDSMSASFLKAVDAEIAELEQELRGLPLYQKLIALKSVRDVYVGAEAAGGPTPAPDSAPASTSVGAAPQRMGGRRLSPVREQAMRVARQLLGGREGPTPIDEIYGAIVASGVEIGGNEPKSNLSAMLSKTDGFASVGRRGWIYSAGSTGVSNAELRALGILPEQAQHAGVENASEDESSGGIFD